MVTTVPIRIAPRSRRLLPQFGLFLALMLSPLAAGAQDTGPFAALRYRNIGPHRGGRVTAV